MELKRIETLVEGEWIVLERLEPDTFVVSIFAGDATGFAYLGREHLEALVGSILELIEDK